ARAARGEPLDTGACYRHGLALLRVGDHDAYRKLCARLVEAAAAAGPHLHPEAANTVAMLCAVAPNAVQDFAAPLALVRQALAALDRTALPADERQRLRHAWLNTEGAVLYRAGDHREAVARLKEAVACHGGDGTPEDWLFLALAHHRLREADQARMWWTKVTTAKPADSGPFSWERVELNLLRREARACLTPDPAERDDAKSP